jgi:hypothetical protein
MDITQLLIAVASTVGIVLIGMMAIIPFLMEASSGGGPGSTPPRVPNPLRPRHRLFHRMHHGRLVNLAG